MVRNITNLVEEQIRRWQIEQERCRQDAACREEPYEPPAVISISRETGTEGHRVGCAVGDLLGIPLYDREIVEHIAASERVQVQTVETLDERAQNRLDDYLLALFRERNFDRSDYLKALTRTVTALWGHGRCILLGRGAGYIVSRRYSLSVRLVAPLAHRVRTLSRVAELSELEALRAVSQTDADRAAFVKRYFGRNIEDPLDYDLVVNLAGLGVEGAAAVIAEAYRRKFSLRRTSDAEARGARMSLAEHEDHQD